MATPFANGLPGDWSDVPILLPAMPSARAFASGGGSRFEHHGIGCVVHRDAVFGKDCHIYQNVTVGAKWGHGKDGIPQIGDRVQIGAGAVLLGPIRIGNDCIIGANAVVIQDVPDGCYALGVPAVVRKRSDVHKDSSLDA